MVSCAGRAQEQEQAVLFGGRQESCFHEHCEFELIYTLPKSEAILKLKLEED